MKASSGKEGVWGSAGRDRSWFGKSGGSDPAPGTCCLLCPPYPALPPYHLLCQPGQAPLPGKLLSLSFALSSIWPWPRQGLHSSIPAAAIPCFFEPGNQVETSGNSQGGSFYSTHPSAPSVWADPHSNWTNAIRTNCKISDLGANPADVWAN